MKRFEELKKRLAEMKQLTEQEMTKDMFDTIEWKGIRDHVTELLGVSIPDMGLNFEFRGGRHPVAASSNELKDEAGIFGKLMKSVVIQDFGSGMTSDGQLYLSLSLRWQHLGGGSNGTDICSCWYNFDEKKWEFRNVGK